MAQSIKLKNDKYWDSSSVSYNKSSLEDVIKAKSNCKYLGKNPDINKLRNWHESGVYGIYDCDQAPNKNIGVLEVISYTIDWCLQRFTDLNSGEMWERIFHYGTTWTSWVKRW